MILHADLSNPVVRRAVVALKKKYYNNETRTEIFPDETLENRPHGLNRLLKRIDSQLKKGGKLL